MKYFYLIFLNKYCEKLEDLLFHFFAAAAALAAAAAAAFASSYLFFSATKSLSWAPSGILVRLVLPIGPKELILPFYGPGLGSSPAYHFLRSSTVVSGVKSS